MIEFKNDKTLLVGKKGEIILKNDDDIIKKVAMIFEGECDGLGAQKASTKYGITRQRYYQLLNDFKNFGSKALEKQKTGPKKNYVNTDEVVRQIIRHKFLNPKSSPEVISQKLIQLGFKVSTRSVERIITAYGLVKKTSFK